MVKWIPKDVRLYSAVPYKTEYRAVVLLEDHEHALVERDLVIAKLTGERDKYKKEALAKFDCQVCSGSLQDEHDKLRADYRALLTEAVRLALYLANMADDAEIFLSRPDVQAYLKEQHEQI